MPLHLQTLVSSTSTGSGALVGFAVLTLFLGGCSLISGTEYAPGFTEEAFRSIKVGDTKEMVLQELGEPLRIVGNVFIYRYIELGVNFSVNTSNGSVLLSALLAPEAESKRTSYEQIKTLEDLTQKLGTPDAILRANLGQHKDPNILTYIYSKEAGTLWDLRAIYIDKKSGKVTGVVAERRSD